MNFPIAGFEIGPGVENKRIVYLVDGRDSDSGATASLLQSLGIVSRRVPGGLAGLDQLANREPGCILVDIDAHCIDATEIFDALPARRAAFPVVVFSAHAELSAIVELMRLGVCDYISKPLDRRTVATSLARVFERLRDETEAYHRRQFALATIADLTSREQDVLRGLIAGQANKTLAHDLGLSVRTIEMHRSKLMARLGVNSLAQTIRLAIDAGVDRDVLWMSPTIREGAQSMNVHLSTPGKSKGTDPVPENTFGLNERNLAK